jgi:ATP adenylyltransferase
MDVLWSPWRYRYLAQGPASSCFFCEKAAESRDRENLVVARGAFNFIVLNAYPYTSGHVLIAPYAHVSTLVQAPAGALEEMMVLARETERHLRDVYRAPGMNLGMNLGECAGAGVAGHIHMHVLPRWPGDVNFLTTVSETRVLPEDLDTTWEKLSRAFAAGRA